MCLVTGGLDAQETLNGRTLPLRVSASQAILDRAYGKAPTLNTSDPTVMKRAIDMTDDELATIASGAKLTIIK